VSLKDTVIIMRPDYSKTRSYVACNAKGGSPTKPHQSVRRPATAARMARYSG